MLISGIVRRVVKLVFLEQVLSTTRIAFGQHAFVFGQKRRTLLGCSEHFVRVPRDRIRSAVANRYSIIIFNEIIFNNTPAGTLLLLCYFIFIYLWMPFNRCLCFLDTRAPPPQAASTCNQSPYSRHTSAISAIGSNAPRTVVPVILFVI